jgi:SAM-dependent methyltransferase
MKKEVLDPCCGGRMFYYDKDAKYVHYGDLRREFIEFKYPSGYRSIEINPDEIIDFRDLPYRDKVFNLVIFDPPHLLRASSKSWLAKKYGQLDPIAWREDIRQGFAECWRVLRYGGTLVFKWSDADISLSEVMELAPTMPLLGTRNKKSVDCNGTYWLIYYKNRGEQHA